MNRQSSWVAAVAIASLLVAIFLLDRASDAAPVQHLYYLPIIWAGLVLRRGTGVGTGVIAVLLYHLANPTVFGRYHESDIVQIALFLVVGVVTERLADDTRRLRRLSVTDDLTGLLNLRGFDERALAMVRAARQPGRGLALLVMDLDGLKAINDVHGHRAGADAVRTVGQLLPSLLPSGAAACRFGGDEFVVALPDIDLAQAHQVADAIRRAVHDAAPTLAGQLFPAGRLSISVGIAHSRGAETSGDASTLEAIFRAADRALYVAKASGRNRVYGFRQPTRPVMAAPVIASR